MAGVGEATPESWGVRIGAAGAVDAVGAGRRSLAPLMSELLKPVSPSVDVAFDRGRCQADGVTIQTGQSAQEQALAWDY